MFVTALWIAAGPAFAKPPDWFFDPGPEIKQERLVLLPVGHDGFVVGAVMDRGKGKKATAAAKLDKNGGVVGGWSNLPEWWGVCGAAGCYTVSDGHPLTLDPNTGQTSPAPATRSVEVWAGEWLALANNWPWGKNYSLSFDEAPSSDSLRHEWPLVTAIDGALPKLQPALELQGLHGGSWPQQGACNEPWHCTAAGAHGILSVWTGEGRLAPPGETADEAVFQQSGSNFAVFSLFDTNRQQVATRVHYNRPVRTGEAMWAVSLGVNDTPKGVIATDMGFAFSAGQRPPLLVLVAPDGTVQTSTTSVKPECMVPLAGGRIGVIGLEWNDETKLKTPVYEVIDSADGTSTGRRVIVGLDAGGYEELRCAVNDGRMAVLMREFHSVSHKKCCSSTVSYKLRFASFEP